MGTSQEILSETRCWLAPWHLWIPRTSSRQDAFLVSLFSGRILEITKWVIGVDFYQCYWNATHLTPYLAPKNGIQNYEAVT